MLNPTKIVIHHSLTPDGITLSWPAIRDYHVNHNGWKDVGYHGGIEEVGGRLVCMFGRPTWMSGAHTRGQNSGSLGFCFVGSFDEFAPPEPKLRVAARRVLAPWCIQYGLTEQDIYAHRDFSSKSCPGMMFDMNKLRQYVKEELRAATGRPR